MDVKELCAHLLEVARSRTSFQPPLEVVLRDLSPEVAAWRPAGGVNSAGDLAHHLAYWTGWVAALLEGSGTLDQPAAAEDWPRSEADRARAVERLRGELARVEEAVAAAGSRRLADPDTGAALVLAMLGHNLYHAGQIVQLRRWQGDWPPGPA